jgi:ABC-2 type transport system permease protein
MKALAAKYFMVFMTRVKNLLEYRTNILLKLVRPVIMTAAIGSLWLVLFKINDNQPIGGFTKASFIVYLITIRFIAVFSPGGASISEMNEEICTGNITMRLVRPIHYLIWLFFRNLPVPLVSGMIGLCLVTLITRCIGAVSPSGWQALLFICSVTCTIFIQYAFYQGIGILSFWIYEVHSVERFYKMAATLLSGEMIPLTLFPLAIQNGLYFLPFASLAFIPGGIYVGIFTLHKAIILVLSQLLWAILLWSLVIWIYARGLRKFEAQGG